MQHATDTSATATATLTYDKLGRKTAMTDADMGTWGYDYNAFGELKTSGAAVAAPHSPPA